MYQGRYYFLASVLLFGASLYLYLNRTAVATKDAMPLSIHGGATYPFVHTGAANSAEQQTSPGNVLFNASSLTATLLGRANKDKLIYLASVDSSYLPMAFNLYETSFKKLGIDNFLFVCSDTEAFRALQEYGVASFDFLHDTESKTPSKYGTKAFRRKTHMKTKIILDALLLGLTVVIMDVDIVLFKNPLPYLDCADCDIQIQSDILEGNSGFYMARPTTPSILLHQKAWAIAQEKGESVSNQKALDRTMESMSKKKQLKMRTLSMELFPPGKVYFENKKRMFYTDNPPSNEVLVHNNWIVSKAGKIYRFKEHLLWMVDTPGGYYTDPAREYLTYENPGHDLSQETQDLKTALLLGHLLNRTVILPTFSCAHCKSGACKVPSKKCAFGTHFKIETFDAHYERQYREHVFLSHPLVPAAIREGANAKIYLLQGQKSADNQVDSTLTVLTSEEPRGPTEEEILGWFSDVRAPVLRFGSLRGIKDNPHLDRSFIRDKAFNTKTDYQQF